MAVLVKIPTQLRARRPAARPRRRSTARPCRRCSTGCSSATTSCARACTTTTGSLRRFVNVYVAGEDIRFLDGLATPVKDGAELTILPAVAGG